MFCVVLNTLQEFDSFFTPSELFTQTILHDQKSMAGEFDIFYILSSLSKRRPIFVSEADFQLELAWEIKLRYPDVVIRLEYTPVFDKNMHLDILAVRDNAWIPLELKYKTKGCEKVMNGETFILKNHGAHDMNRYLFWKDVGRIERVKRETDHFLEGYAIMLTNEKLYWESGADGISKDFTLRQGVEKHGLLQWAGQAKTASQKQVKDPIMLEGHYLEDWQDYSRLDNTNTGMFKVLVNRIH